MRNRKYIGDGVYASIDSTNQIWIQTQRSAIAVESIALEPETMRGLIDYAREVWPADLLRAVGIHVPQREETRDGSNKASG